MGSLSQGDQLGPYRIIGPLGRGGMGEVYRAHDPRLGRDVAIKVIAENLTANEASRLRFEREAKVVATLSHPNIVSIFDIGVEGGSAFLVSELLEGRTLRHELERGPLPVERVREWGSEIADGIAAAHLRGIVHRDLKPENILITIAGRVKILDFGLARIHAAAVDPAKGPSEIATAALITEQGVVLGTVGYMSPEQIRGEGVGPPSDIFALGCVLYEMATGQSPFLRPTSNETLVAVLHATPKPPSEATPGVPRELDGIIDRCLRKNPLERYGSAVDLGFALRTASEPAASAERSDREPKHSTRRRRLLWLTIAAVALIAVAAAIVLSKSKLAKNPLASARFVRLTDFEGTEQAAAISRDGRFVAFLADRDGPVDVWVTQVGSREFRNVTGGKLGELINPDIRTIGFSPDGALVAFWVRRKTASALPDISVWAVPTLGGEPRPYLEGAAEFDWSSDGSQLVYHTPGPGDPMVVREGMAGPERRLFEAPEGVHNHYQLWSPDDEFIYFVHGSVPNENDVWRIEARGGEPQRLTSHNTRVTFPAFLDRNTLLYLATDADGSGPWLYALDVGRRESHRISSGVERYTSLSASADGRHLAATVANPRRTLWRVPISDDVAEEQAASRVPVPIVGGRAPRVGSNYLLYVSSAHDAESIWKLAGGVASELWHLAEGRILGGPAISPDGRIAFTAEKGGQARMYVMKADGSGVRMMPESLEPRGAPAWSPDGESIAVAAMMNGKPKLVKVSVADQIVTTVVSEFAADPVWSSDGKTIIYSGLEVGTTLPIHSVRADDQGQPETKMTLSRGARRVVFLPLQNSLVVLRGEIIHKNFWLIDLDSGHERRLTNFGPDFVVGGFDVAPDGSEIVFDREQEHSDVVLIER